MTTAILAGPGLNGRRRQITLPGGGGGGSNPTPPAITGVSAYQGDAISPAIVETAAGKFIAGTFAPLGGTGPFTYELNPVDSNGFTTADSTNSRFATLSDRGNIVVPYSTGSTNARTLKITDATGATSSQAITINTSATAKQIFVGSNRSFPANTDPYAIGIIVALWTGSAVDTSTTISVTDPAGFFTYSYGVINLVSLGSFPPPGSYPITVNASGYTSRSITIVVTAAVAGTPYFLQTLSPVSTSILAGTVVGRIIGTTPNNKFVASLTDATGTLAIDGYNVVISTQPASPGSLSFSFTITDQGANTSASCLASGSASLTIAAGTTLPSTNMVISGLTTAFNNDTWNNTIGTPTVSGVTGTKQWSLVSQTGYNKLAVSNDQGTSPARYQIDASTGAITAPAILSAGPATIATAGGTITLPAATDTLVVSCTDGINTCTRSVSIVVSWAAVSRTIYVGAGMASAHGADGFDHIVDLRKSIATSDYAPHSGTYLVNLQANAAADYFANDTGTATSDYAARFPWPGPIIIQGVALSGARPRTGGPITNNSAGGGDMRGKGNWVFGNGDAVITNLEVSAVHDAITDGSHGIEAVRKDGETYGNLTVSHCYLHDCDNGIETGICHGTIRVENTLIENGGTSYVSSGATHNAYVGKASRLEWDSNVSRRSQNGYDLKSRAAVNVVTNSRFFDGLSGSGSSLIDFPNAGQASVSGCFLEKGPMALGPDAIRYGEEGYIWDTNTLTVSSNTIAVLTLNGGHYGAPDVVWFNYATNSRGVGAMAALSGNSIYRASGATVYKLGGSPPGGSYTEAGTTTLTLPGTLDTSRPDVSGTMPGTGPLYRHQSYGQDTFAHFDGAYQYQDRDQIRIPASTAAGTTICTLRASNQLGDQGAGTANPFGASAIWSIVTDATYDGSAPWAASGKYTVTANGDGSAALKVGSTALASGVDYVQVRVVGTSGVISDSRYAVIVS